MIKTLSLVIAISFVLTGTWVTYEPQLIKAVTDTVTITQQVTTGISISDCADFGMSQSLNGVGTGATSGGICTWVVNTANAAGFSMTLYASQASALTCTSGGCSAGVDAFADYSPAQTTTPDFTWAVTTTNEFGFTVKPETTADTVQKFLDNGSACGTGAANASNSCWYHFATAGTPFTIINRSTNTTGTGEAELVEFWAEVGESAVQAAGTYEAIITATATDNP